MERFLHPHEAMKEADKNADSFYIVDRCGCLWDVIHHGPEWFCIRRCAEDPVTNPEQWTTYSYMAPFELVIS